MMRMRIRVIAGGLTRAVNYTDVLFPARRDLLLRWMGILAVRIEVGYKIPHHEHAWPAFFYFGKPGWLS